MSFRVPVREGQTARAIVISSRTIAPVGGRRAGIIEEIPVIDRVGMFVNHHKEKGRSGNTREFQPLAIIADMLVFASIPSAIGLRGISPKKSVHREAAHTTGPTEGPLNRAGVRIGRAFIDVYAPAQIGR